MQKLQTNVNHYVKDINILELQIVISIVITSPSGFLRINLVKNSNIKVRM